MKHNPLQVVLNSSDYIYKPDPNPGGSLEDFYGGRDDEFREHKASLERQIDHIQRHIKTSDKGVGTVKVELNPSALAKSHRPMRALFPAYKSPHIGGLNIGTLLFQVTPGSLDWLRTKVSGAELESRLVYDEHKRKMVYKPSSARSETGAVERISLYSSEEKLNFTADEAVEWFNNGQVSNGYLVELIEYVENRTSGYEVSENHIETLRADLKDRLLRLGAGVIVSQASLDHDNSNILYVRLYKGQGLDSVIDFNNVVINRERNELFDLDPLRHELLLSVLVDSPLIKKITLPPMISRSDLSSSIDSRNVVIPSRISGNDYPLVGIIDSGVNNPALSVWKLETSKGFSDSDCDPDHGSQVASLLVAGKILNPQLENIEDDGCLIYDIWTPIHSERNTFSDNFDGLGDFFDWLDIEVKQARAKGVRIFNFSINFKELVKDDTYSFAASQIDRISKKHDVIFVISAGNLGTLDFRAKWPSQLAITSDIDRIQQPAEAVSAITVGAINPPGYDEHIHGTPTVYSRRGPGVAMGVKPDVVHYGGFSSQTAVPGVLTLNSSNVIMNEGGTSFSAPFIAKILASVEHKLNKQVSRNALISMLIHHTDFPSVLNNKEITTSIKRRFVGFGAPTTSDHMLVTDDHSITVLFEGKLNRSEVAEFEFQWPESLVNEGKCSGLATLTLAYDPVTSLKFGAEYCRINIDSFLQQEKLERGEWKYRKNCDSIWKTEVGKDAYYEKNQIEHGLKWWPVKKYKKIMKQGVGKSKNWRLKITSTEREPGDFPSYGIGFCVIMTIEDYKKQSSKIFDEVKQSLSATGVDVKAIHVTSQVDVEVKI
tara:strand:- start:435 stop:2918 length:2484 start_codon:yes stop_codon:yes gene_type:complete